MHSFVVVQVAFANRRIEIERSCFGGGVRWLNLLSVTLGDNFKTEKNKEKINKTI